MKTRSSLWMQMALLGCMLGCVLPRATGAQAGAPPPRTVQIGEIGSTAHVALNVGDTLRILLKTSHGTGYSWQVSANDDTLLKAGEMSSLPAETRRMGSPGRQSFAFTARSAGRGRLLLEYSRPWEKNVPPARTLSLDVVIRDAALRADPAFSVKPAGVLIAQYRGKLPCADCNGIQEVLSLYTPGPNDFVNAYYVEAMTYMGGHNGDSTNVTAGSWFLERGIPSDPNASVYALSIDSTDRMQNYQLKNGALVPLNEQRKPVQSPFDMTLRRIP